MQHEFRAKLKRRQRLLGTMITLSSAVTAEILSRVGFDWLFIDAEHGSFSAGDLQNVVRSAGPDIPCVVRVAAPDEISIKKALDVGASGIIAPQVNDAETAQRLVRYCKYPPEGSRGVGIARAMGYGLDFEAYLANANDLIAVIAQAEHIEAVKNIESIVQVPGLDGMLVGPYDLSASMGFRGQVDHPEVVAAIEHVTEVCQAVEMPLGIFGVSAAAVRPYLESGYTFLIVGVDTLLLGGAAKALLAELR